MDKIDLSIIEYAKNNLEEKERILALAEEASELSQAALKLHRAMSGKNPTPITVDEAMANVLEEYGDVENVMETLITATQKNDLLKIRSRKMIRWSSRISAMKRGDENERSNAQDTV